MMQAKLSAGLKPVWVRLNQTYIDTLTARFQKRYGKQATRTDLDLAAPVLLGTRLGEVLVARQNLDQRFQAFQRRYARANRQQRAQHLLDLARDMGADSHKLRADRKALKRNLDEEAMADRYRNQRGALTRESLFLLERLGTVSTHADGARQESLLRLTKAWDFLDGPEQKKVFWEATATILAHINPPERGSLIPRQLKLAAETSGGNASANVWERTAALRFLLLISPEYTRRLIDPILQHPQSGDHCFLRHRLILTLADLQLLNEQDLTRASQDPSPFVRQALCRVLPQLTGTRALELAETLIFNDPHQEVRGAALTALPMLVRRSQTQTEAAALLTRAVAACSGFAARTAIKVVRDLSTQPQLQPLLKTWQIALCNRAQDCTDAVSARDAASAAELIWIYLDEARAQLYERLKDILVDVKPGKRVRVPRAWTAEQSEDDLGRILAVVAQDDFGLDLESGVLGYRIRRTPRFGFRFWRLRHEWRHPASDKRQGFNHTRGRISSALVRAPSGILAESSPAHVPGEPLLIQEEGGGRRFLPLPDDALAALDAPAKSDGVQFYTPWGRVQLKPPRGLLRRIRAWMVLTTRFQRFARLRNWRKGDGFAPDAYSNALRKLDFEITLQPLQKDQPLNQRVSAFFSAAPLMLFDNHWPSVREYVTSFHDNNLRHLIVFLGAALSAFFLHGLWLYARIRAARRRIPLVIGGWGTRGKSGTERLKAALFHAIGLRFLSKTTGCEARFLFAPNMDTQKDLPLFRPMGKATIWEQGAVTRLAASMNSEVMLWECMGLNPLFVRILQKEWMRDDISTITNAHPDHEDLQGPSGFDVAQTIAEFTPSQGRVLTSEQGMIPVLRQKARQRRSSLQQVNWLESGLLPRDLLARFPYAEHPDNIALVLQLAQELGVEPDFALKEMADRVVPDLGVLKTYPAAPIDGRMISFVNGMSANERHGCLSNWTRLGFDRCDPKRHPDTLITLVVNNREDRPARSRIFSDMLIHDLPCDLILLAGSNLKGMQDLIQTSLRAFMDELDPFQEDRSPRALAVRFRIAHSEEMIQARLQVMLKSVMDQDTAAKVVHLWRSPKDLVTQLSKLQSKHAQQLLHTLEQDLRDLAEIKRLEALIAGRQTNERQIKAELATLLQGWFKRKLVVVPDPLISGDDLLQTIVKQTPPGMHNRVMGIQNIKGPGIELVRCFNTWEAWHQLAMEMIDADRNQLPQLVRKLEQLGPPPLAARDRASQMADVLKERGVTVPEALQQIGDGPKPKPKERKRTRLLRTLCGSIEPFLDGSQSVRRRRKANQIYRDLIHQRIGFRKAADLLQDLDRGQQKGWLYHRLFS